MFSIGWRLDVDMNKPHLSRSMLEMVPIWRNFILRQAQFIEFDWQLYARWLH